MTLRARPLHPLFAAEISGLDLRRVEDEQTLVELRAAMDAYAVCVFRDQPFDDDEQMELLATEVIPQMS